MVSFERAELDEWVQTWLQANKDCEQAGDWTPLAGFYAVDATYGWNIGPKEDVMCIGIDEIRDIALGLEMHGLQDWQYPYQKVIVDDRQGRSSASGSRWSSTPTAAGRRSTASAAAGFGSTPTSSSSGSAISSTSGTSPRSICS